MKIWSQQAIEEHHLADDGTMQCFVWHKDQKAVCHCLAAILNVADDSNKDASS